MVNMSPTNTSTSESKIRKPAIIAVAAIAIVALLAGGGWCGWKAYTGRELAEAMQAALRTGVDPDNHRQAKASQGVYLMEHVNGTAVLVECGFLSNYEEAEKLTSKEYQKEVAEALCVGILTYLNAE